MLGGLTQPLSSATTKEGKRKFGGGGLADNKREGRPARAVVRLGIWTGLNGGLAWTRGKRFVLKGKHWPEYSIGPIDRSMGQFQ